MEGQIIVVDESNKVQNIDFRLIDTAKELLNKNFNFLDDDNDDIIFKILNFEDKNHLVISCESGDHDKRFYC